MLDNDYTELTAEEIEERFKNISCTTGNSWTYQLNEKAPCGMYKVVPYFTIHLDLSNTSDDAIKLYDYSNYDYFNHDRSQDIEIPYSSDNQFEWIVPYDPFYINSEPNDESYLAEFDVLNDDGVPYVTEHEKNTIEPSYDRDTYIIEASEDQAINYIGYEDYETEYNRIDKFVISAFIGKEETDSDIRMKVPYMARLEQWSGDGSPINDDGTIKTDSWSPLTHDSSLTVNEDYKQYMVHVSYNELVGELHSGQPSVTYYRVVAEDESTTTVYKVNVVPGVRNKVWTFEIATDKNELHENICDRLDGIYDESHAIYQEIIDNYGPISAIIKELNGDTTDNFQTKWFETPDEQNTEPTVYNLKAHVYDISVDLPVGYTYDVYLMGRELDGSQTLRATGNGFSGKKLILGNPDAQEFHIRIILKRSLQSHWGVNYVWTQDNANKTNTGLIQTVNGGKFNDFVYSTAP